jgi:hypothetical protein
VIDAVVVADAAAQELRWQQWKTKGRNDDAQFRRRLRTILVDAVAVAFLGGAVWFAFQVVL